MHLPVSFEKHILAGDWQKWSEEQQAHIVQVHGQPVTNPHYDDKHWEIGKARPQYGECCPKCSFDYCFYAMPRNCSISHTADVYNLMRCANMNCQHEFSSIT